jgi:hypothetical protein
MISPEYTEKDLKGYDHGLNRAQHYLEGTKENKNKKIQLGQPVFRTKICTDGFLSTRNE